jgi:4-amino-4-deoxy-L-arabinose transferase-like glycosyltransferase
MIDVPLRATEDQPEQGVQQSDFWPRFWRWLGLGVVMLVSIFMNFYQLGQNGYGNLYYAAGVRSMADSLHNFFFVSLDPGGFVTIDKPPLGFWLQVASVKILGFTPFAIFLPQALAGVLAVLLLSHLVRRHFGVIAGLLAALALAISPISVVTNRNNTIDSTLVLAMLLGAWAVMRAAETGKLRWLLLSAVCIGLGFNIKMLEAYLVVPAFGLLYLLAAPRRLRTRLWHLAVAALLMLVLSFSWAIIVDAIPASQRPYVGSSQDNSELSLALGYNGLERLAGMGGTGGTGGAPGVGRGGAPGTGTGTGTGTPPEGFQPPEGGFGGGPGGYPPSGGGAFDGGGAPGGTGGAGAGPGGGTGQVGVFNTGLPGPFRLFTEPLGGQIAWLLPLAMLGALALLWQRRRRDVESNDFEAYEPASPLAAARQWFSPLGGRALAESRVSALSLGYASLARSRFREDREQQSLVLWGMWLLTMGIFYSVAGFFHQYYLSTFAPAIAALFGIGLVVMWRDYHRAGWRGWLLPLALLLTAAEQISLIESDPSWGTWLIPLIAVPTIIAAVALFAARLLPQLRLSNIRVRQRIMAPTLCLGLAALLLTPAVWSAIPGVQNIAQDLPIAGASQQGAGGGTALNVDTALISYLEAHQGSAKYLVAVSSAQEASSIILATNKPVMALGGFTGSDPILTTSQLAKLVSSGVVRYFLIGNAGGGGGPGGGQSSLLSWITARCTAVSSSQVGTSNLYDCSGT